MLKKIYFLTFFLLEKSFADNSLNMSELDVMGSKLEKNLDDFRKELYSGYEPRIHHIDSVDIDMQGNVMKHFSTSTPAVMPVVLNSRPEQLPPLGPFNFTPVKPNQSIYAMRSSLLAPWGKGRVIRVCIGIYTNILMFIDSLDFCLDSGRCRNSLRCSVRYRWQTEEISSEVPGVC